LHTYKDIIIIGGGAAGFFAAINIAEKYPDKTVCILEKGKTGLQKVKISGGGRCNVTHAEFIPSELIKNYPRGEKELLGPFHHFMTGDTMAWFEERGVSLKIEDDGRIFPVSNSSSTIIECFLSEAEKHKVEVLYSCAVNAIYKENDRFTIATNKGQFQCEKLVVASGSSQKMWNVLKDLGHSIVQPVPSLFTFDINDTRINSIPGVVAKNVEVKVRGTALVSDGPLLITHVGMSAPAILKLSAFGALELAELGYNFEIEVNFICKPTEVCLSELMKVKSAFPKKAAVNTPQFGLPRRLWKQLVLASQITDTDKWANLTKDHVQNLAEQLTKAVFQVTGKSTFKEEFVTAGGVDLKEVDFRTFQSKLVPNLYFAGEVLNVDAITGGFNFQNAWTGGYIVSQAIGT
jgi:predicted Rossmann fold flavoprotein